MIQMMKINFQNLLIKYYFLTVFFLFGCKSDNKNDPSIKYLYPSNIVTTGRGDVVIFDSETKIAHFITQSGVLFKSVSLHMPDSFSTFKRMKVRIHNTPDSLFLQAEWIGDKVFWDISTNKLNTRQSDHLGLSTIAGTEIIRLCTACIWTPVFNPKTGKTTHYSVNGMVQNISIDEWNAVQDLTYRATSY